MRDRYKPIWWIMVSRIESEIQDGGRSLILDNFIGCCEEELNLIVSVADNHCYITKHLKT